MLNKGDLVAERYEVLETIQQTSTVGIFKVRDYETKQVYALKINLNPQSIEINQRLKREFFFLHRLHHPNIVRAYGAGMYEGSFFIIEELVDGVPITSVLRGYSQEVIEAILQILDALHYLHHQQLVHHDLKPENIIYRKTEQDIKILDLGFAEEVHAAEAIPGGSIGYIAPEVIKGIPPSPRTDLYSFGVIFYEILTAKNPFFIEGRPESPFAAFKYQFSALLQAPSFFNPKIPREIDELVLRLLALDPYFRPAGADEVIKSLGRIIKVSDRLEFKKFESAKVMDFNPQTIPFVGRSEILERFRSIITHPSSTPADNVLILKGDIGIGKSRLLFEFKFLAQVEGRRILFFSGESGRSLFETLAGLLNFIPAENIINRFSVYEELTHRIVEAADQKKFPQILIIDDLDLLNEFDLGLFRYLALNSLRLNLKIVGATNIMPEVLQDLQFIVIPPLNRTETSKLVNLVLKRCEENLIDLIFERSSGVPLILIEILKNLITVDDISRVREIPIPEGIHHLLEPMINRLKEDEKTILKILSVIKGSTSLQFLQILFAEAITDFTDERFFTALHQLKIAGILRPGPDSTYTIANKIVSDIVESQIGVVEKEHLHKIIGEKIEEFLPVQENLSALARHFKSAGIKDKAYHYCKRAGEKALTDKDFVSARQYLSDALGLIPEGVKPEERLELLIKVCDIELFNLGDYDRARFHCEQIFEVIDRLQDEVKDPQFYLITYYDRLGCLFQRQNEHNKAVEMFEQVERALKERGIEKLENYENYCQLLCDWAFSLIRLGENRKAKDLLEKAESISRVKEDYRLSAKILRYRSMIAEADNNQKEAIRLNLESIDLYTKIGDDQGVALGYHSLGYSALKLNNLDEAIGYYDQAIEYYEKISDILSLGTILDNIGVAYLRKSDYNKAKDYLERALFYLKILNLEKYLINTCTNLAEVYFYLGEWNKAMDFNQDALKLSEKYGDLKNMHIVYNNIGKIEFFRGEIKLARDCLSKSSELLKEAGAEPEIDFYALQARIYIRERDFDKAREYLVKALRQARHLRQRKELPGLYALISEFYESLNDFKRMLRYSQKAIATALPGIREYGVGLRLAGKAKFFIESMAEGIRKIEESIDLFKKIDCPFDLAIAVRDSVYLKLKGFEKGLKIDRSILRQELEGAEQIFRTIGAKEELEKTNSLVNEALWSVLDRVSAISEVGYISLFQQLGDIVNVMINEEDFASRILDLMINLTGAERGLLFLIGNDGRLKLSAGRDIDRKTLSDARDISKSILDHSVSMAEPIYSLDASLDDRFRHRESVILHNIRSILCAPLKTKDDLLGAIYLDSRLSANLFPLEHKDFIMACSSLISATIEKSLFFKRFQERDFVLEGKVIVDSETPYIIGVSKVMKECYEKATSVAKTNANVLLTGETGTGKGVIARLIHNRSRRRNNLFLSINCGVLPETLFESTLFGHRKGSFTGAVTDRKGAFETANGGTIFLDEINSATPLIQTKLLEAIEDKIIRRLGEDEPRKVDVRLICATNVDLESEVVKRSFREDLFHRIARFIINVPPLRERPEDIIPLAEFFLRNSASEMNKRYLRFSSEVIDLFLKYPWPGNIRELINTIDSAVIVAKGEEITVDDIESRVLKRVEEKSLPLKEQIVRISKSAIIETLKDCRGNISHTAVALNLHRRTLQRLMRRFNIRPEEYKIRKTR